MLRIGKIDRDQYSLSRRLVEPPEKVNGRTVGEVTQDQATRTPGVVWVVFDALAGVGDRFDVVECESIRLRLDQGVGRDAHEAGTKRSKNGRERLALPCHR